MGLERLHYRRLFHENEAAEGSGLKDVEMTSEKVLRCESCEQERDAV